MAGLAGDLAGDSLALDFLAGGFFWDLAVDFFLPPGDFLAKDFFLPYIKCIQNHAAGKRWPPNV